MMNCICGGKLFGNVHILCTWIHGDGCGEELLFSLPRLQIETLQYTPHTHSLSTTLALTDGYFIITTDTQGARSVAS